MRLFVLSVSALLSSSVLADDVKSTNKKLSDFNETVAQVAQNKPLPNAYKNIQLENAVKNNGCEIKASSSFGPAVMKIGKQTEGRGEVFTESYTAPSSYGGESIFISCKDGNYNVRTLQPYEITKKDGKTATLISGGKRIKTADMGEKLNGKPALSQKEGKATSEFLKSVTWHDANNRFYTVTAYEKSDNQDFKVVKAFAEKIDNSL